MGGSGGLEEREAPPCREAATEDSADPAGSQEGLSAAFHPEARGLDFYTPRPAILPFPTSPWSVDVRCPREGV